MSLDTRYTDLNNNWLVIGGSGAGKTFRLVGPNIMQMSSSFIVTDPKGEICRKYSKFLENHGYEIKVVNLLNARGMIKSTRYNPFRYIMTDTDIVKLVTNFFENTKKKGAQSGDQFWDDMAGLLLQAFLFYTRDVGVEVDGVIHRDFKGVMKLVNMAKVEENPSSGARIPSELDMMFKTLEYENPDSPAVIAYNKATVGAADTVRSIISSLNSRTTALQTNEILDLLSDDEIDIASIGTKKTALFCIIPDVDKTYNFLIGMLYTQIFQELYYQADFVYKGALPVHVTFMLDEFANVALPDDYCSLLSTMRSREISSIIIIQNLAQIKKLFEKDWESLVGCCDTLIYLGGNEKETHKYISEYLGKMTIDKKSTGKTRGKQSSSSKNFDVLGRELMMPDEVRKLKGKKCLVFIRGYDPVIDDKIHTPEHPFWREVCECEKKYDFDGRIVRAIRKSEKNGIHLYTDGELKRPLAEQEQEFEEYEILCKIAEIEGSEKPQKPKRRIISVSAEEFLNLNMDDIISEPDIIIDESVIEENRRRISEMKNTNSENDDTENDDTENDDTENDDTENDDDLERIKFRTVLNQMGFSDISAGQINKLYGIMETGKILTMFNPQMDDTVIEYLVNEITGGN